MRVTPRGSTSIDVRMLIAETDRAFGSSKLRWCPFTSCKGKLQNSRPSSEYPPAKPRMPCAEMYLFGCVCVVDQSGRSGTRCELPADVAEEESCARLKLLSRRIIGTKRTVEPPSTAWSSRDERASYPQIIPSEARIGIRKLLACQIRLVE